jgi:ubiquitin carboxyl-terminal hydrolase MINDY-3/4
MQNCLALAIADILYNASNDGETDITLVIPQGNVTSSHAPILPHQCCKIIISGGQKDISIVYNLVKTYLSVFNHADCQGVILLVYSCILTRGVKLIQSDMDLEGGTLLNEHGYASQEIINLMLIGQAKSNVHDGDNDLGEGFVLKGIEKRSDVGFLSFFEAFGYFTVGDNLKTPRVPIWVVCS